MVLLCPRPSLALVVGQEPALPIPGYRPSTVHNWQPELSHTTSTSTAALAYDKADGSGTKTRGDLYPHGLSKSKRSRMLRHEEQPACEACSVQ